MMIKVHAITAFDPGVTTGIAVRYDDNIIFTRAEKVLSEVYNFVLLSKVVVYEDFVTGFRIDTNGLHTVRLVGSIIALCHVNHIPCYKHTPFKRKAFQKESHLLLKGTKHLIHEEDALAHLLAFEHWGN